ncbi:Glycerophosphodiester phosphodiesterase [Austwickia sp. TVS 96-490-7B]|uniref:glycerophosphodiester phosphodiesterase family protein n=1 Tax=Austwickia sp. TVS 96-490-7B TaxID=2830843 RepID=UPI001C594C67|nr:glycerophosphodiester phosphodiesterase family protein [Austwickia sp. TVS 96-490-7B]MBW3084281.1 Glycerophosphodiester phosphodiesterase [Austwickia sp. TVS 96-490-7B]
MGVRRRRLLTTLCVPALIGAMSLAAGTAHAEDTKGGAKKPAAPSVGPSGFDLESHRGGRGETTEESLKAFQKSLALGVTTLELDVVLTKDKVPAVWHDPKVLDTKCVDTKPATPGDKQFPYVGKLVHDLTWAQLQTLNCGKKLKGFPDAEVVKNNKIAKLSDVFDLAKRHKAGVWFNIETKIEAEHPEQSATPKEFVDVILGEVTKAQVTDKVMIQSFDWRSLPLVKKANPKIPTVLLWDESTWVKDSPWTNGIDIDSVRCDIVAAAKKVQADILSPGYSLPYGRKPGDADFRLVADKALVDRAHKAGLKVIPWTINDPAAMEAQIDAGADGIITDYPTKLRDVMKKRGMKLPAPATMS